MTGLKIEDKWKWAAMDINGSWIAYLDIPIIVGSNNYWSPRDRSKNFADVSLRAFDIPHAEDWQDSLHEIKDGKLIKYVDIPADGERVIVGENALRRISAGVLSKNGNLLCYFKGMSKWTSHGALSEWLTWRRPTPKELEE